MVKGDRAGGCSSHLIPYHPAISRLNPEYGLDFVGFEGCGQIGFDLALLSMCGDACRLSFCRAKHLHGSYSYAPNQATNPGSYQAELLHRNFESYCAIKL